MRSNPRARAIRAYYRTLYNAWGPQHWWPGRTPFEVIVGAYLTQNTSWKNVEVALRRLRSAGLLKLDAIRDIAVEDLEVVIRSTGYFRQKAARLKTFVKFVDRQYGGSLKRMFAQPTQRLRQGLLSLNGVGSETADSILLYAGQHPVFVVDAYARRILERHEILPGDSPYDEIRELFESALTSENMVRRKAVIEGRAAQTSAPDTAHKPSPMSRAQRSAITQVLNDAHALIVAAGKQYCFKSNPDCDHCPLRSYLPNPRRARSLAL